MLSAATGRGPLQSARSRRSPACPWRSRPGPRPRRRRPGPAALQVVVHQDADVGVNAAAFQEGDVRPDAGGRPRRPPGARRCRAGERPPALFSIPVTLVEVLTTTLASHQRLIISPPVASIARHRAVGRPTTVSLTPRGRRLEHDAADEAAAGPAAVLLGRGDLARVLQGQQFSTPGRSMPGIGSGLRGPGDQQAVTRSPPSSRLGCLASTLATRPCFTAMPSLSVPSP